MICGDFNYWVDNPAHKPYFSEFMELLNVNDFENHELAPSAPEPSILLPACPKLLYYNKVSKDQCHIHMWHWAVAWTSDVTYVCAIGLKRLRSTHTSGHTIDFVLSPGVSDVGDLNVLPISSNISDHDIVFFDANLPKTYSLTKSVTLTKNIWDPLMHHTFVELNILWTKWIHLPCQLGS